LALDVLPVPTNLPPVDVSPTSASAVQKSVDSLVEMAMSDCTDIKSQAIQMLCSLTSESAYCDALVNCAGGVKSLLNCLAHKNEDVHRCALTALANLTDAKKRQGVCGSIIESPAFGSVMDAHVSSPNRQIVREAARAIANVADSVGFSRNGSGSGSRSGGLNAAVVSRAVDVLTGSADSATRFHADRIAEALNRAGINVSFSASNGPFHAAAAPAAPATGFASTGKSAVLPDLTLPSLTLMHK